MDDAAAAVGASKTFHSELRISKGNELQGVKKKKEEIDFVV